MKFVCVALACSFLMSCSNSSKKPISPLELEYPADLNMVSRADWGWLPPAEITAEHEIGYITIHHGGVDYPPENDPLEHIVNLQSWSRSEK